MARYIVMGVSGCGKTSIGHALAIRVGGQFVDGDDLHPDANIAKMARGEPLTDADRKPWLRKVSAVLKESKLPVFVGCSALRRIYRDWIREGAGGPVTFLHLTGSRDVIAKRMSARADHFMPLSLLDSQFATLEPLEQDETALAVDIDQAPDAIVSAIVDMLSAHK